MNKINCLEWNVCNPHIGNDSFYQDENGEPNLHCESCGNYKPDEAQSFEGGE